MGSYIYIIKLKIKCWILQHIIVHYSMIEVIFKMCFNQVSVIQNFFFLFKLSFASLYTHVLIFYFKGRKHTVSFFKHITKNR